VESVDNLSDQDVRGLLGRCARSKIGRCPEPGARWGNGLIAERQVHWLAFWFVPVGWLTGPLAAPVAGKELAVSEAVVAAAAAEIAAVAGRGKGTTTPCKGRRTRQEETVPTGSVARPILRNEQDTLWRGSKQSGQSVLVPQKHEGRTCPPRTNKKRKVLDIANKKRNTAPCFEVGYVSSSFLHGADDWYPAPLR
jgi:hypothetical protein